MIFPHKDTVANKHKLIALMVNIIRLYSMENLWQEVKRNRDETREKFLFNIFSSCFASSTAKMIINDLIDNQPDRKSRETFEWMSQNISFLTNEFLLNGRQRKREKEVRKTGTMWCECETNAMGEAKIDKNCERGQFRVK